MNTQSSQSIQTASGASGGIAAFCLVAGSSILFCSKGVVAKLAYAQGADALTVLSLRMGFALPFFAAIGMCSSRGAPRLHACDWAKLAGLGFLGYYLSSLVNFTGLQHVSVGLERIILYTYPTLVVAFSALVFRKPARAGTWIACLIAWLGIAAAYAGELRQPAPSGRAGFGAALIFASAVTYALFLMLSGPTIQRVGPMRFTGMAVGFSCVLVLGHFAAARPISVLWQLPAPVYVEGIILALFGTVAPAILMSQGLKRTDPQKFAIISTIGPVTTVFLAWTILGERPNGGQIIGFALALSSGLAVTLLKEKKPARIGLDPKSGRRGARPFRES